MKYRAIYRCRLCGKEFYNGKTYDANMVISDLTAITCGKYLPMNYGNPHNMVDIHYCIDGGIGLADIQGFEAT